MSKTYFRFPDQLVLITEHHEVNGTSEFKLTIRGTVRDYAEAGGRIFWMLEPNLDQISPDDFVLKLIDDN